MVETTLITATRLREILHYDPESGELRWLISPRSGQYRRFGGRPQFTGISRHQDWRAHVRRHRLAFLWMEGRWPMEEIDHANGDKTDNRWSNLREATQSQNTTNARTSIRNTSGYRGVSMDRSKPRQKKWRATIEVDGRTISLGYFDTPERAFIAYIFAAWDHFGDFARVR
jgi:HNH endonuclease/AP2 domain